MINNSVLKLPHNNTFKGKEGDKKIQENEKSDINITDENDEEYSFESTARVIKNQDRTNNAKMLRDALMALTFLSLPIGYIITDMDNSPNVSSYKTTISEEDMKILHRADSLAKNGKRNNVLEADEFLQLLDYSKMNDIPNITKRNIKCLSTSSYIPINMEKINAQKEILSQVKNAQYQIDYLCNSYKNTPMKSSLENYAKYARDNITDREILENIDFSELAQYQSDLTLIKGIINFSRDRIKRDDTDVFKKKQKAIKDAQKLVNEITNRYKTRAKVSGNYNGDNVLSKGELASLLNTKCLDGLPESVQLRIISKALEDYNPRILNHIKKETDAERENERVEQDKQKAQEKLNDWAFRAHKEFAHILHPDEIMMTKD